MTAISYGGETPTVGGDEDTWGAELNTALTEIKTDLDMLNTATANSILGRNEGTSGEVERLTATEVTAMLNNAVGDSGSGGTKGLVPAPATGDAAARKFLMASGAWVADERKGWAVITGATGAVVASRNIACSRAGSGDYDFTFSTALADANYAVFGDVQTSDLDIVKGIEAASKTASGFTYKVTTSAGVGFDPAQLYVQVIG